MKKAKTKMTLDKLAEIVKSGFKSVDKGVDAKLEKLVLSVAKGFASVDERFDAVDKRFNAVDERFDKLETSINTRFFEVHDQLGGLQNQMENLEKLYINDREEHKVFRSKIARLEEVK